LVPVAVGATARPAGAAAVSPAATPGQSAPASPVRSETERGWAAAVEAYQQGDPGPLIREFTGAAMLNGPLRDYARYLVADADARRGELALARSAALAVADRYRDSRLAPRALLLASVLASESGDEAAAQAALVRLLDTYRDSPELTEALYLLGLT